MEEISKNTQSPLELKRVQDLLDPSFSFYVPGYQRGYRWRPDEVKTLILDILRFTEEESLKSVDNRCPFYCLQALVIKEVDGRLEVIDGQQRLTTILIILQAINTLKKIDFWKEIVNIMNKPGQTDLSSINNLVIKDAYSIKYETRKDSNEWLKDITLAYLKDDLNQSKCECEKLENRNADYYHFVKAYKAAIEELSDNNIKSTKFEEALLENTRLIYYNTSLVDIKSEDVDIFDDINATKIALNNAELVKAIFLQEGNFPNQTYIRDQMAMDWDRIEKQLQEPSFWGFVYSTRHPFKYATHIEYLFDLLAKKTKEHEDYYYFTFNKYHNSFIDAKDKKKFVQAEWDKLKKMMLTLEEWYKDKTCYHYIGYLLEYGIRDDDSKAIDIPYLVESLKEISKNKRTEILKAMVKKTLKDLSSSKLFHDSSGKKNITQVLFLLNIQSEQNRVSDTARFSFAKYKEIQKDPGWNQEHVASNTDYVVKYEDKDGLAYALLEYYTGVSNKQYKDNHEEYVKAVKENYPDSADAQKLCDKILKFFDYSNTDDDVNKMNATLAEVIASFESDKNDDFKEGVMVGKAKKNEKDFIWNFALLNATTNKSYGNDIYPLKRKRIMSDEECIYTPICTRGMFEKAYSKKLSNLLVWGRKDAYDFWGYICKTLKEFLPNNFDLPFKY